MTTQGDILFEMTHLDTHGGWFFPNYYAVPQTGIWVITLHCGDVAGTEDAVAHLLIGGRLFYNHIGWQGLGTDMASVNVVLYLEKGWLIESYLYVPPLYSDSTYYQTSLVGFLYSPVNLPAVAFCTGLNTDYAGPYDPLPFGYYNNIYLNEGSGFNYILYNFFVPADGLYYFSVTGTTWHDAPMKLELI